MGSCNPKSVLAVLVITYIVHLPNLPFMCSPLRSASDGVLRQHGTRWLPELDVHASHQLHGKYMEAAVSRTYLAATRCAQTFLNLKDITYFCAASVAQCVYHLILYSVGSAVWKHIKLCSRCHLYTWPCCVLVCVLVYGSRTRQAGSSTFRCRSRVVHNMMAGRTWIAGKILRILPKSTKR